MEKSDGGKSLAVVYSTSELGRNALKTSIYKDLKARRLLKKDFLPYRRGCKQFEKVLGPWRDWEVGAGKAEIVDSRQKIDETGSD